VFQQPSEAAKFGKHGEIGFGGDALAEDALAPKRGQRESGDL
jgi:hypothetical protein